METLEDTTIMRTHLRSVKYVAAFLIVFTVTISFTVTLIVTGNKKDCDFVDSELTVKKACVFNTFNCVPFHRFPLTEEVYVVVCVQENDVIALDIRHYVDQKRGLQGITLNQNQWLYLKSSVRHVDKALLDAKQL